jgi:alpha(1,3/1,4) fucosyltransferase
VLKASLVATACTENQIFDLNGERNRDNCLLPFHLLRERFLQIGIELNTPDLNKDCNIEFELHLDVQKTDGSSVPKYAVLFETPLVHVANANEKKLSQYKQIFTWNDRLVDGVRFHKINFPNDLTMPVIDGVERRPYFCSMIAANKSIRYPDDRELYSQRIKAILWFENYHLNDFSLYGIDWHLPLRRSGFWGKVSSRLSRLKHSYLPYAGRPSYKGKVRYKSDVLQHTRYAICFENAKGFDGYITEKIFDCFFSGCVPVYWGADNVTDFIPPACFIDMRSFPSYQALYEFLIGITDEQFAAYQAAIQTFLSSRASQAFGAACFVDTLFNRICADLNESS